MLSLFRKFTTPTRKLSSFYLNMARNVEAVSLGEEESGLIVVESWMSRIHNSIKVSHNVRGSNFVQMATVDEEGSPRVRTVVFRGFSDKNCLKFITDSRSEKVIHLSIHNTCEICYYFAHTSEQYRISGGIDIVGSTHDDLAYREERINMWDKLSEKAKQQFFWPDSPGLAFVNQQHQPVLEQAAAASSSSSSSSPPPANFLLLLLRPRKVHYLNLLNNFAQLDVKQVDAKIKSKDEETDAPDEKDGINLAGGGGGKEYVVEDWISNRVFP